MRHGGDGRVVLSTDLSDPVGNAIHPRIGDRPMLDALELRFVARA